MSHSPSPATKRRSRARFTLLVSVPFLLALEAVGRVVPAPAIRSAWTIPILLEKRAYVVRDPLLFWKLPGRDAPHFNAGVAHRILCLADSVTVMDDGHGYPEILEALLAPRLPEGVSVWNAGVPGYTTEQALRYLGRYAAAAPTVITVQLAWNDHVPAMGGHPDHEVVLPSEWTLRVQGVLDGSGLYQLLRRVLGRGAYVPGPGVRVPLERYEANLRELVSRTRELGAQPLLLTSPYLSDEADYAATHRAYNERLVRVASELDVTVIDPVPRFVAHPELFLRPETDHVHFNPDGSRIIAEMVADRLVKTLARR